MSGEDWLNYETQPDDSQVIIGSSEHPIIRPHTKNLIEAPEKSFKTTFLLRLMLGLSTGETVFDSLPVVAPKRGLYLHGELSTPELKERLQEGSTQLRRPLNNFFQGRSVTAGLITAEGKEEFKRVVVEFQPEVLAIDPWQSFIAGADENSFKELSGALRFLDELMDEHGLTIVVAIHQGKNTSRGARGHSSVGAWRDTKFVLKRSGNSLTVDVDPRWARPSHVELVFKHGTLWEGTGPRWSEQAETIRRLVIANNGELSREQVGLGLGLKNGSLRMALKRAHDQGAIEVDDEIVRLPSPMSHHTSPNHPIQGGGFVTGR